MKSRCHNPKNHAYKWYGGRGITVCAEWRQSLAAFAAHVGPRPSPEHSIDRIDNSKGYEPGNVRWATVQAQKANRSVVRLVTIGDVTRPAIEWGRLLGLSRKTVWTRLKKGWDPVLAVTHPPSRGHRPKPPNEVQ